LHTKWANVSEQVLPRQRKNLLIVVETEQTTQATVTPTSRYLV